MSELAKALVAAQSEFPAIERSRTVRVKTKTGGSYTFSYAPLDAILNTVRPALTKNGLAVTQLLGNIEGNPALRTVLLHEGGESLEEWCPLPSSSGMSAQEFGSLVTYFRRYALVALLGIAAEEDDDGNAASGNHVGAEPSRSPAVAADEAAASAPSFDHEVRERHTELVALVRELGAEESIPSINEHAAAGDVAWLERQIITATKHLSERVKA